MKKIAPTLLVILLLIISSCSSTPKYTIIFDSNGGEGSIPEQKFSVKKMETLEKNIFTRDGYTFIGWDTNNDGIYDYTDEEALKTIEESETITLKAIWVPENH